MRDLRDAVTLLSSRPSRVVEKAIRDLLSTLCSKPSHIDKSREANIKQIDENLFSWCNETILGSQVRQQSRSHLLKKSKNVSSNRLPQTMHLLNERRSRILPCGRRQDSDFVRDKRLDRGYSSAL